MNNPLHTHTIASYFDIELVNSVTRFSKTLASHHNVDDYAIIERPQLAGHCRLAL